MMKLASKNPLFARALAFLGLIVAMVSIQSGASLAKKIFQEVGAPGATALRLIFAALILNLIWRPWRTTLTRRERWNIVLFGATLGAMNLVFYLAIARIPLGLAVALEFIGPLAVVIIGSRQVLDFFWVLLAVIGLILILPLSSAHQAIDQWGVLFALIAGVFWGLYIVFGKRVGLSMHAGTATALGMVVAALVAAPFGILSAGTALLNPTLLPIALAIALLSSAIPYSLEMMALKRLPSVTFGILMSLEPALAALSGLVFLRESLSFTQWGAISCVVAASLGSAATHGSSQN